MRSLWNIFLENNPRFLGLYIYIYNINIYSIYIYISIFESPKIEKNTKHHFWRITILVFFNNFSNMEKNSWENHHAKWWDFPAMFDDIYSFWIISCGEFPMSFFFGSTKKAGLLEAKKWVNIVTRKDIDHLIFVLQYLFVSTVSWVLGATLKKVSVSLDPQNDGTFTKKIWHNQSTKNFGLDIFRYFSIFFHIFPIPKNGPPNDPILNAGFKGYPLHLDLYLLC